ncbi:DUF4376 domain-containing protein [Variovorax paradoxus]|uniref:DUF4376 domain-containing protein n=1 Tax=Variovorax paradoxus TaxID=34073 RepID=A0A0H2MAB4_VARPD|nr:DUF4376 domain-containing protein [Variovorax paradoxus]KLN57612.1 hypothetical protein VPARA_11250 [Variovorax paradoxus]
MPDYTAFDRLTGRVIARGTAPSEASCLAQSAGNHECILIGTVPDGHYVDVATQQPVAMGAQPSVHHVFDWDSHAWIDPRTMDDRRKNLRDRVTARRWEIETSGITLASGVRVLTAKSDQNRVTSVIVNATAAGIEFVDFKADSGWVLLSVDELKALARGIALHVQACFSAERVHHAAIDLLATEADTDAYDIEAGWPTTDFTQTQP